ncbi:hypothetical protein ASC84_02450 [Acinetobacter sp. Root1280]|uniref:hypothetical protein n=1 Tax=Acinetobacter sp. Root1280 TaxID=1736444 RepID=UPI0006F696F9|nr:hypothetical protein [Acinetobacter sp. Root1280]KQX03586.1 hypothetical protein ASC84_02450 [Acinetobacter sp. Root1280]
MKKVVLFVLLMSQLVFVGNALASDYTGKVESILVRDHDGLVYIYVSGTRSSNTPNCANKQAYMMIKNENSPTGKRQLGMLMMAQATNKTVIIVGANTCTRWYDGEDIEMVILNRK